MSENYGPYPTKLVPSGGGGVPPASGGEKYYPSTPSGVTPTGGAPMPVPGFNRQKFVENYANMVARTWAEPNYLELILADPVSALTAAGLPVPDGSVVRIIQHKILGQGTMEDQIDKWIEGLQSGRFDVYLPMVPDDVEIPESPTGGDVSLCCCSPCCCCT
jgi:hypothetical protein